MANVAQLQSDLQPRQDSNLDQAFRKRLFYPLNYGAVRRAMCASQSRAQRCDHL